MNEKGEDVTSLLSSDNSSNKMECSVGSDVIEFFNSLNWNPPTKGDCQQNQSTSKQNPSSHDTSFICKDELRLNSYALKLINSDLLPYSENAINLETLERKYEKYEDTCYVPGVENGVKPFYVEFSKLNKSQQSLLYNLFVKRLYKTLTKSELESFHDLMTKASEDHQPFQRFVSSQWITQHYHRCLELPISVIKFIDHLWNMRIKQSLKFYPSDYKVWCKSIPLTLNDPFKANAEMSIISVIKIKGGIQRLFRPYWHRRLDLVTDFHQLCKLKPDFDEYRMGSTSGIVKPILPASLDPDVDSVILNENIDVVITSSGIKTIVENAVLKFSKEWILPVIIKEVHKPDGKKKVVIIDKNLPPISMSNYDKNKWYAKIASKWALMSCRSPNWLSMTENYKDGSLKSTPTNIYYDCNESSDAEHNSDIEEGEIANGGLIPEDCSDPKSCSNKKVPEVKTRLVYKLWDLHKSSTYFMSKQEQRNLKILTRFRIDGKMTYMNYQKQFSDELCLSSRLEFQPEYGASVVDSKDLIREYIDLFVRNHTKLCRVRSVGHTQEVMLTEIKTLQDIREGLLAEGIKPKTLFDPLYAVLTQLVDQPPGSYLLQHKAHDGAFVQLLVQADSERESTFKLSRIYNTRSTSDVSLPPRLIDPYILTAIHQRDRTVPALFEPKHHIDTRMSLTKPKTPKIKKKKKRSKTKAKKSSS